MEFSLSGPLKLRSLEEASTINSGEFWLSRGHLTRLSDHQFNCSLPCNPTIYDSNSSCMLLSLFLTSPFFIQGSENYLKVYGCPQSSNSATRSCQTQGSHREYWMLVHEWDVFAGWCGRGGRLPKHIVEKWFVGTLVNQITLPERSGGKGQASPLQDHIQQILNQRVCGGGILSKMMSSELAAWRERTRVSCREEPWILIHLTSFMLSASRENLVSRRWYSIFSRNPLTVVVWNREPITLGVIGPDVFRARSDENEENGRFFSLSFYGRCAFEVAEQTKNESWEQMFQRSDLAVSESLISFQRNKAPWIVFRLSIREDEVFCFFRLPRRNL